MNSNLGYRLFTAKLSVQGGDSGGLILSEDGRFPVGLVVASSNDDPNITYCHRLVDVFPPKDILGIFSPLGVPENSSELFREIVASMVPDGLFIQDKKILLKKEQDILSELGVVNQGGNKRKQTKTKNRETIAIGDKIRLSGPLAINKQGEIVGIAFASSGQYSTIQRLDKNEKALRLKLISQEINNSWKSKLRVFHLSWHLMCVN